MPWTRVMVLNRCLWCEQDRTRRLEHSTANVAAGNSKTGVCDLYILYFDRPWSRALFGAIVSGSHSSLISSNILCNISHIYGESHIVSITQYLQYREERHYKLMPSHIRQNSFLSCGGKKRYGVMKPQLINYPILILLKIICFDKKISTIFVECLSCH